MISHFTLFAFIGRLVCQLAMIGSLLVMTAAEAATVVPKLYSSSDGTISLNVQINPPMPNPQYSFYVAGTYNGQILFLGQDGNWHQWDNVVADIPAALVGSGSQTISVLNKINPSGLAGARIYAGFGISPSDLLSNNSVTQIYTVAPPACVSVDCMTFGGKLVFQANTGDSLPVSTPSDATGHIAENGNFSASTGNGCRLSGQLVKQYSPYASIYIWSGPAVVSNCSDPLFNGTFELTVNFGPTDGSLMILIAYRNFRTMTAISISGILKSNY